MAEETVILNFQVDQAQAVTDLQKTEKAILNLKEEQKELSTEYKKGVITQDQYVKENIKLQNSLKKETDQKRVLVRTIETESNSRNALKLRVNQLAREYDKLNLETAEGVKQADKLEKELAQLNSQLTKGDKAAGLFKNQIGNYPAQFGEAAKSINVAGVSVGDITSKLASFANPATAAIGIVAGLGAVYASSTRGAKDLSFAQTQLSEATKLVSNSFANLVTSGEDGEGFITKLLNSLPKFLASLSPALVLLQKPLENLLAKSKELALIQEQLEDLARKESDVRATISDRLSENSELMTEISNEENTLGQRLGFTDKIAENLTNNQKELLGVLTEQLVKLRERQKADEDDESITDSIKQLEKEIGKEKANTTKRIQANIRLQDDLNAKLQKQLELERGANRRSITSDDASILTGKGETVEQASSGLAQPTGLPALVKADKLQEEIARREQRRAERTAEAIEESERRKQVAIEQSIATAASIFDQQSAAYKVLATADATINTYKAANLALSAYPPPFSYIAAATTIAAGLANVAKIQGFEFADGGYTGSGAKYEPKGVVHGNEFVIPSETVNKYGGPQYFNKYLPQYADGGHVSNNITDSSQQALIMANAIKNLPPSEVSVVEINRVSKKVAVREKLAKLKA